MYSINTVLLKDTFTQIWNLSHYLLNFLAMESQVTFYSPQNISGAS